jgi:hypothetical protein
VNCVAVENSCKQNIRSYFIYKVYPGVKSISFSWSFSGGKTQEGRISIYSVSGKQIASVPIAGNQGTIPWTMPHGKMARGIYFVSIYYGNYNKNLRLLYQ